MNDEGVEVGLVMRTRILKYRLNIVDIQPVVVNGRVVQWLSSQEQNGRIFVWAIVDESWKHKNRYEIRIIGTGNEMPKRMENDFFYLNTVLSHGGVWHVFPSLSCEMIEEGERRE